MDGQVEENFGEKTYTRRMNGHFPFSDEDKLDSDQLSWFIEPLNREGSDKKKCQDALSYWFCVFKSGFLRNKCSYLLQKN